MSSARVPSILMVAALTCSTVANVQAQPPNAPNSIVDRCLSVCPAGDIIFHVDVRDENNQPIRSPTVILDFGGCPAPVLCPPTGSEPYDVTGRLITRVAESSAVEFPIRAGGVCGGGLIYANYTLLAVRAVSSPDQNGDGMVDAVDGAILTAKLAGPYDPTADLNCTGSLEDGDESTFTNHFGHSCPMIVPTRITSWARIKTLYR